MSSAYIVTLLEITVISECGVLSIGIEQRQIMEQLLITGLSSSVGITRWRPLDTCLVTHSFLQWSCSQFCWHKSTMPLSKILQLLLLLSLKISITHESCFVTTAEIRQIKIPLNKRQIKNALLPLPLTRLTFDHLSSWFDSTQIAATIDFSLTNQKGSVVSRNLHVTENTLSFAGSQTLLASENEFNSTTNFSPTEQ